MQCLDVDMSGVFDPNRVPAQTLPDTATLLTVTAVGLAVVGGFFYWLVRRTLSPREDLSQSTSPGSHVAAGALLLVGTYFVAQVIGSYAGMAFAGYTPVENGPLPTPEQYHQIDIIRALIVLLTPIPYILFLKSGGATTTHIGLRGMGKRAAWIPLLCVTWTALSIATGWFAVAVSQCFDLGRDTQEVLARTMQPSDWRLVASILSPVMAAPLAEEFVFRVGLFGLARRYTGFWPAAIIVTLFFASLHGPVEQPQYIVPVSVLGLSLCWVYEQSRNVWFPVALHAFHNASVLLLTGMLE
ncbi:MAG: CPBP family intramembrane metalloprotease [Planctomycetaceae bacterium]|nr:CPBP family intramembrane metalloprotease [Planctomycetaceae bacterium]